MDRHSNPTPDARNLAYADMDEEPLEDFDFEMPSDEELDEEFNDAVRMYVNREED